MSAIGDGNSTPVIDLLNSIANVTIEKPFSIVTRVGEEEVHRLDVVQLLEGVAEVEDGVVSLDLAAMIRRYLHASSKDLIGGEDTEASTGDQPAKSVCVEDGRIKIDLALVIREAVEELTSSKKTVDGSEAETSDITGDHTETA